MYIHSFFTIMTFIPQRCMNMYSRLKDLRNVIRWKIKGHGLTRPMLYHMLKKIVFRRVWDMTAFVVMTDVIDDVYNVVANICSLCKIRRTTLLQYLAGYIGSSSIARHFASAKFHICSPAY